MSISDEEAIKVVQAFVLPETVEALNVYYFQTDFQEDQEEEDIVTTLATWIEVLYAEIETNISLEVAGGLMKVYRGVIGVPYEWDKIGEASPVFDFALATDMLPHGCSALLRAYTTRGKTIGRKYIPGFAEGAQLDGTWVASAVTNLIAAAAAWGTNAAVDGNNRLAPGVFSTTTELIHPMTDEFVVPVHPAYQRRRRPGVGS